MLENFKFINNESINIAFHIPSNKIFRLTKTGFMLAKRIVSGDRVELLSKDLGRSVDEIRKFVEELGSAALRFEKSESNLEDKKIIGRVTIHVANDCNLACTYCYGNEGTYNHERKLMSVETAKDIVDFLTQNFSKVNGIVFFGGEPMLNTKIIRTICECFKQKENKFPLPKFSIITNGTILNNDVIELINDYLETVVVSIDGPKEANDLHRKFKNGKGSFIKVYHFIKVIKNRTNALVKFESTYTNEHELNGYSKKDISSYLKSTFEIQGSLVDEMFNDLYDDRRSDAPSYNEVREMFFSSDRKALLNENFIDIILSIAKGTTRGMCPIGEDIVAISVDGDIIPCHVLLNDDKFSFGSIYSDNIFSNPMKYYEKHPFLEIASLKKGVCKECWIRNLCGGCTLRWFYNHKEMKFNNEPHPELCRATKEFYKNIILNLGELQNDQKQYISFVNEIAQELNCKPCTM